MTNTYNILPAMNAEIRKASGWTDLFTRSDHVLHDDVLGHCCLVCSANIITPFGEGDRAEQRRRRLRICPTFGLDVPVARPQS